MALDLEEGNHYQVLPESVQFQADKQVTKIFSVNCPFCYKYEKSVIPGMVKNLPSTINYDAYHISSKSPFGAEASEVLAVAKTVGEAKYKAAKMALYAKIHDEKTKFATGDELIRFGLSQAGISQEEFNRLKGTPEVKQLLAKWDQGIAIAKIQGIPALVVNGKYLINTKSIRSMPMLDEMILELSKK
ncbi:thiol:disulfide interchange protein DsbA/DsbL [Shewanella algae]|nr:thiol:disulfide interchange protein DsbA/DsbL [Shewanella algae]MBO2606537.1 thiol:disulfide interchange protein DsbA/DsbL [Shewanella algae]MBO2610850.1 thiol:disulfide interchange protein DsbA/DsbL [Shewanella algae]MBO2652750.1 thiol:disulfide interchange protein DsbA/DsbL [Shewanella algae]QTE85778.1 thiol:disulfide interchange protein DsbA/DsbL [Shewanella algae]HDS1199130.1 thiol:disulfide interchange protein DsbA/DsbL [Shewanella algae]